MAYRYALTRENHEDLSPGEVLHSAPGFPAFPVRLASETFQRALAEHGGERVTVWDPCCGSGYLLTVLGLVHHPQVASVLGSDLDEQALGLARRNLALLTADGLAARRAELLERAERWGKDGHAVDSVERLARRLADGGGDLPSRVASSDALDPEQLRAALDGERPDLVVTDVPYGEQTTWAGPYGDAGVAGMLDALGAVLDPSAVVAVATRGRKVAAGPYRSLSSFRVGTRAVALFRPGTA